jgi:hypothetical protein
VDFVGETSRLDPDYREIAARVLGENGIATLAGVEFNCAEYLTVSGSKLVPSDAAVAQGAQTIYSVTADGIQQGGPGGPNGVRPSIFHSATQAMVTNIFRELCEKFKTVPGFKGFYCVDGAGWGFATATKYETPVEEQKKLGFEDGTIALFEKETGTKIPVATTDMERFRKRYDWIRANAEGKWLDWRCGKIAELRNALVRDIRTYRPDLKLVAAYHLPSSVDDLYASGLDFSTYIKWDGQALDLYRDSDAIAFSRYGFVNAGWGPARYEAGLQVFECPSIVSAFKGFRERAVCIKSIFHENELRHAWTEDWNWDIMWIWGPPHPAGEHAGWQFARAMADSDPNTIVFGWTDDDVFAGHEQELRSFAQGYLPLPREEFKTTIAGKTIDKNLIVRMLEKGNETYFYVLNPGWWSGKVEMLLSGKPQVVDLTDGSVVKYEAMSGKGLSFDIPPYGLRSFKTNGRLEIAGVKFLGDVSKAKEFITSRLEALRRKQISEATLQAVTHTLEAGDLAEAYRLENVSMLPLPGQRR